MKTVKINNFNNKSTVLTLWNFNCVIFSVNYTKGQRVDVNLSVHQYLLLKVIGQLGIIKMGMK